MTLLPGDPAPTFTVQSSVNPAFVFDTTAGRYAVLSFFFTTADPSSAELLDQICKSHDRFDVTNTVFFGVSIDPADQQKLKHEWPGIMYFWDFDQAVSRAYGVIPQDTTNLAIAPVTFILDPAQRILAILVASDTAESHVAQIFRILDSLPNLDALDTPAPVIFVPHVFETAFCRSLIDYYNEHGGADSGFMRDVNGKTIAVVDHRYKRRSDCEITEREIIQAAQTRLSRRVLPAIRRAFQFSANRIERNIIACYDGGEHGHFRAHRDNTTFGTAHRRFAVTINLNAEEYDGGDLCFAEFSRRKYRAPTGGAIVFSCSLLHEATPVTRGRRFAFLPFLYDDAAAQIRQRNMRHLENPAVNDVAAASGAVTVPSSATC